LIGWNLLQTTNLATGTWISPNEIVNVGTTNQSITVSLSPPAGNEFYRLILQ
jgi:hypothetical protein